VKSVHRAVKEPITELTCKATHRTLPLEYPTLLLTRVRRMKSKKNTMKRVVTVIAIGTELILLESINYRQLKITAVLMNQQEATLGNAKSKSEITPLSVA